MSFSDRTNSVIIRYAVEKLNMCKEEQIKFLNIRLDRLFRDLFFSNVFLSSVFQIKNSPEDLGRIEYAFSQYFVSTNPKYEDVMGIYNPHNIGLLVSILIDGSSLVFDKDFKYSYETRLFNILKSLVETNVERIDNPITERVEDESKVAVVMMVIYEAVCDILHDYLLTLEDGKPSPGTPIAMDHKSFPEEYLNNLIIGETDEEILKGTYLSKLTDPGEAIKFLSDLTETKHEIDLVRFINLDVEDLDEDFLSGLPECNFELEFQFNLEDIDKVLESYPSGLKTKRIAFGGGSGIELYHYPPNKYLIELEKGFNLVSLGNHIDVFKSFVHVDLLLKLDTHEEGESILKEIEVLANLVRSIVSINKKGEKVQIK